jgi:hypothetical protein
VLDQLFLTRSLPETLIVDKGPEFSGTALDACKLAPRAN